MSAYSSLTTYTDAAKLAGETFLDDLKGGYSETREAYDSFKEKQETLKQKRVEYNAEYEKEKKEWFDQKNTYEGFEFKSQEEPAQPATVFNGITRCIKWIRFLPLSLTAETKKVIQTKEVQDLDLKGLQTPNKPLLERINTISIEYLTKFGTIFIAVTTAIYAKPAFLIGFGLGIARSVQEHLAMLSAGGSPDTGLTDRTISFFGVAIANRALNGLGYVVSRVTILAAPLLPVTAATAGYLAAREGTRIILEQFNRNPSNQVWAANNEYSLAWDKAVEEKNLEAAKAIESKKTL